MPEVRGATTHVQESRTISKSTYPQAESTGVSLSSNKNKLHKSSLKIKIKNHTQEKQFTGISRSFSYVPKARVIKH